MFWITPSDNFAYQRRIDDYKLRISTQTRERSQYIEIALLNRINKDAMKYGAIQDGDLPALSKGHS